MSYKSRKAVYAGSFDPLTNGHLWMINQGLDLFDHLTVAIGINPDKEYTYEVNERIDILGTLSRKHHIGYGIGGSGGRHPQPRRPHVPRQ